MINLANSNFCCANVQSTLYIMLMKPCATDVNTLYIIHCVYKSRIHQSIVQNYGNMKIVLNHFYLLLRCIKIIDINTKNAIQPAEATNPLRTENDWKDPLWKIIDRNDSTGTLTGTRNRKYLATQCIPSLGQVMPTLHNKSN